MPDNYKILTDLKIEECINENICHFQDKGTAYTNLDNTNTFIDYKNNKEEIIKWDIAKGEMSNTNPKENNFNKDTGKFAIQSTNSELTLNMNNLICAKTKLNTSLTTLLQTSSANNTGTNGKVPNMTFNVTKTYPINPRFENNLQLWGDCDRITSFTTTFDTPINVKGGTEHTDIGNTRSVNLNIYSNNQAVLKRNFIKYDGNSRVWLLTHGWNSNVTAQNNGWIPEYVDSLKKDDRYKNDIILTLDWSSLAKGSNLSTACPNGPNTWIEPIAEKVATILKEQWGFTKPEKINMIGHSLGTIMISTLTDKIASINNRNIGSNSNIYLSPPGYCPFFNEYQIDNRFPYTKFSSYTNRASNSISFVQQGTLADQFPLGNTAKYTVSINSPDVPACGDSSVGCQWGNFTMNNFIANKHNTNPKMVNQILFNRQLVNENYYTINNIIENKITHYDNTTIQSQPKPTAYNNLAHINFEFDGYYQDSQVNSMFKYYSNVTTVYGSNKDNIIQTEDRNTKGSNRDYVFNGHNKNDEFRDNYATNKIIIRQFGYNNSQDRISLSKRINTLNDNQFTLNGNTIKGIYKYYTAIGEYKEKTNEIVVEGDSNRISAIQKEFSDNSFNIIQKR
jgi:hypothetical protein